VLLHRLLFGRPKSKIAVSAGAQLSNNIIKFRIKFFVRVLVARSSYLVRHWVIRKTLNSIVVGIFENPFQFRGPNDDTFVRSPRGKPLSVSGIGDTIHGVLVSLERLDQRAVRRVIDKDPLPCSNNYLATVGPKAKVVNTLKEITLSIQLSSCHSNCTYLLVTIPVVYLIHPRRHSPHDNRYK